MTLKAEATVITMGAADIVRLEEVLVDNDAEGALQYLKDVIVEKLKCAQAETHRTQFEGGTGKEPSHFLQKGEGH